MQLNHLLPFGESSLIFGGRWSWITHAACNFCFRSKKALRIDIFVWEIDWMDYEVIGIEIPFLALLLQQLVLMPYYDRSKKRLGFTFNQCLWRQTYKKKYQNSHFYGRRYHEFVFINNISTRRLTVRQKVTTSREIEIELQFINVGAFSIKENMVENFVASSTMSHKFTFFPRFMTILWLSPELSFYSKVVTLRLFLVR